MPTPLCLCAAGTCQSVACGLKSIEAQELAYIHAFQQRQMIFQQAVSAAGGGSSSSSSSGGGSSSSGGGGMVC